MTLKKRVEQRDNKQSKDMIKKEDFTAWSLSTACELQCYLSCLKCSHNTWGWLMLPADWHLTCNMLQPQLKVKLITLIYIQETHGGKQSHMHTHTWSCRHIHMYVGWSNTHKVNNLTGVRPGLRLPPSLSFCPHLFLFQHSFSTRTPVPLSINYLYCLRSDLRSPVRICMDGARQACLIFCHREFSIFI